jgi:hypothetical protein
MVGILAGAATLPDAPGWVHRAAVTGAAVTGVVAIGTDATGAVVIGTGATGAVVIGMAAIGTTGTEIGVIVAILSSLLVTSAFPGGGAGAVDIPMDITATGIRTVITGMVMATEEGMDTVTTATVTAMDMATVALAANTALAANMALPLGRE